MNVHPLLLVLILTSIATCQENPYMEIESPGAPRPNYDAPHPNYHAPHPNQYGSQATGISDGHRLITRALWRIFDALTKQKNNAELHGKIYSVEKILQDMNERDSKIQKNLEDVQETLKYNEARVDALTHEVEQVKGVHKRLIDLEQWQLSLLNQRDQAGFVETSKKSCPDPFDAVSDECFLVATDDKRDWEGARKDCSKHGADLASPKDLPALMRYLRKLQYQPEYVWVGGSKNVDGKWVWATGPHAGAALDMSEATWNEGLPGGVGDCLGLYVGAGYRAYDYSCTEFDYYVCQYFI